MNLKKWALVYTLGTVLCTTHHTSGRNLSTPRIPIETLYFNEILRLKQEVPSTALIPCTALLAETFDGDCALFRKVLP